MTKNRQVCEFHHRPKRGVRRLLCAGSVVAAAALAPTLAAAQEAGEGEGDTIVVSGYRYLSENTSGTTGLPVPIEKVPQSIRSEERSVGKECVSKCRYRRSP